MSRIPRAEAASRPISTRVSPIERQRLALAARRNHQSVSTFLREAANDAAADCLEPEEWRDPSRRHPP